MKQNVKTNNTSREVILTESKTMREGYIHDDEGNKFPISDTIIIEKQFIQ
jgi:hypothetical protein